MYVFGVHSGAGRRVVVFHDVFDAEEFLRIPRAFFSASAMDFVISDISISGSFIFNAKSISANLRASAPTDLITSEYFSSSLIEVLMVSIESLRALASWAICSLVFVCLLGLLYGAGFSFYGFVWPNTVFIALPTVSE